MARKQSKKNRTKKNSQPAGLLLASLNTAFRKAYSTGQFTQALEVACQITSQYPAHVEGWVAKADAHGRLKQFSDAIACMQQVESFSDDLSVSNQLKLAQYQVLGGHATEALPTLEHLSKQFDKRIDIHLWLSQAYHALGKNDLALEANDKANSLDSNHVDTLLWRSRILDNLRQHTRAKEVLLKIKKMAPTKISVNNHLGSLAMREGAYDEAEQFFNAELALQDNSQVSSNLIIAKHYNPKYTAENLKTVHQEWAKKYQLNRIKKSFPSANPAKKIRLGLLSGGFRVHPVGQMVLPALRNLSSQDFELFVYSTNQVKDPITEEVMALASRWRVVESLTNQQLSALIHYDDIDILVDMNGGGDGSRYQAISCKPAPIIVKWVGMQINTTGLDAVDYFLSDHFETPQGSDELYTEKLIRMPDDYICYQLPSYMPSVTSLPALQNQYITFGCLNNPAKLSLPLIKEWAQLLREVSGSKLLLRGIQFEGEDFKNKIMACFAEHGIDRNRLLLKGPARHEEFLKTYQSIDIALDTWPYSGGLTTCEALAMGVPVVTCVGPTFAGRHSATHLANAGLPELVTDNWADFRKRVKELAADLPNLAVIRAALPTILKESPVCDGERFAKHLTKAMRGIWQRHSAGKAPEALTFNKEGDACFADEDQPIELVEVKNDPEPNEAGFEWNLETPITVIDNGALFARQANFVDWMQTGNFAVITLDPGSLMTDKAEELKQLGEWHHYPHATLGDGKSASLYVTLDPKYTGTLQPLGNKQTGEQDDPLRVLSILPISSVALDAIEGLPDIDLLVLDGLNNASEILINGKSKLDKALIVHAKIVFNLTHSDQPTIDELALWAINNNYALYTIFNIKYNSAINGEVGEFSDTCSQIYSADAVFIRTGVDKKEGVRQAFLMHEVFCFKDKANDAFMFLGGRDSDKYEKLISQEKPQAKNMRIAVESEKREKEGREGKPKFVHVCFNNIHTESVINVLQAESIKKDFDNEILIAENQSMPGYNVNVSGVDNASFFSLSKDFKLVVEKCLSSIVSAVYFHGLFFEWQKELLQKIAEKKKTIWVMWGGDLYNPISTDAPIDKEVKLLYGVSTWQEKDYDFFVKHYGQKNRIPFRYSGQLEYFKDMELPDKEKLIIVGNSGDPSNNHLEILENLSKFKDIHSYRLIIPFGYNGSLEYLFKIKSILGRLGLSGNVVFLEKMLDKKEYYLLVAKAEFIVFAHQRQQGGGNLTAALYFGTKVIMRKYINVSGKTYLNSLFDSATKNGHQIFNYEECISAPSTNKLKNINYPESYSLLDVRARMRGYLDSSEKADDIISGFNLLLTK